MLFLTVMFYWQTNNNKKITLDFSERHKAKMLHEEQQDRKKHVALQGVR